MDRLTEKTGGPAFGTVISLDCVRVEMDGSMEYEPKVEPGNLTVRDYFAAKAMQGYIACGCMTSPCDGAIRPFNEAEIASGAYAVADAMMAAREA